MRSYSVYDTSLLTLVATTLSLHATQGIAAKCAAPPILLPYRNSSITPGILIQGIPIRIGTPPQHIALTPSLMLDNTFIPRYSNSCIHANTTDYSEHGNSTKRAWFTKREGHPGDYEESINTDGAWRKCAEVYGGGYDPSISTTGRSNKTYEYQEGFFNRSRFKEYAYIQDTFIFTDYLDAYTNSTDSLPEWFRRTIDATVIVPDNETEFAGMGASPLGLTPDSTLLARLASASMIPSTSWSLTNTSLCLGCIDKSASKGTFHNLKPADRNADPKLPCLIHAEIEALNWYPEPGKEGVSLIKEPFSACIEPGVEFMVLPEEARLTFSEATRRSVDSEDEDGTVYHNSPGEEAGWLNFHLKGGLEVNVTITGSGRGKEGGEWIVPIGKGGWGSYGAEIWTLGKPFTDAVVLKWDSGAREFGIANLNEDPGDEDIGPLGCDEFPEKKTVKSTTSTATIVGTVVGGFVSGVVFAAMGMWFFKRGEKGVKSKYEPMRSEEALPMGAIAGDRRTLDSTRTGAVTPVSIRTLLSTYSRGTTRVSSEIEPQLVEDNSIFEAPEGGTAYPTKRPRQELGTPSMYQR
ncbi:hypothetical protein K469DRAFT_685176 [Zopfia rhizophila CBS 207.26]|uniref:Peptidase A1 domain-containing protein n=1 Tax=Zopfia rhizophila CBS 207.26 TaxID=1314779 RepID=A0A6A6DAB3_9PEZI|nr:hypothetical protein K469DRAFT_685176 [Zopfia rhizophila CBS 207.26]